MAVIAEEKYGRQLTYNRAQRTYVISGTTSDQTAREALQAEAPATVSGMGNRTTEVREMPLVPGGYWIGYARWSESRQTGGQNLDDAGDEVYDFNTTGGTIKVTQSLATRDSDAVAGTATDFQRSIGVEGKGGSRRVAGVDITVPQFAFTVTRVMATASVNTAFTQMLADLTGTVNVASHTLAGLSFAAEEVLFLGARGTKRGNSDWEIQFQFAAGVNNAAYDASFGMTLNKKAWDYVWWYYEQTEDGVSNRTATTPAYAYSEQVYSTADFTRLPV